MNVLRSRVALFASLAACLSLSSPAAAGPPQPTPPSLTVNSPADSVDVGDTIDNVIATPRMLGGRLAALTSPVSWAVTAGKVAVYRRDTAAHRVMITAIDTGHARVVATWHTPNGQVHAVNGLAVMDVITLHDSLAIVVRPVHIDSMVPFNVVSNGQTSFVSKDPGGWCLYRVDWHRSRAITGRPSLWSTNDSTFLNAITGARAGCSDADTTVDPQKVNKAKTSP